jgi:hypothetical protein
VIEFETQQATFNIVGSVKRQAQRRARSQFFDTIDVPYRRRDRKALTVIARKGVAVARGESQRRGFASRLSQRLAKLVGPAPRRIGERALDRRGIGLAQRRFDSEQEMYARQHLVVEEGPETVDPGTEAQFEDRGEILPQRRAILLARGVDKAGDEAFERVAAREERNALPILQAENADRHVVKLVLGNLEQLVARVSFEDMRQCLAVVALRIEAATPQNAGNLEPQERYGIGRAAIGERREKAEEDAHAGDGALRPEQLHTDRVHADGTMDRGATLRLGDEQRLRGAQKALHLGRKRVEITQTAEEHVGRIAHDAETGRDAAAALIETIIATAEKGEIVVVEPGEEIEGLGELALAQRRLCLLERRARLRQDITHPAPIRHRDARVLEHGIEPRRDRREPGGVDDFADLDMHQRFARALAIAIFAKSDEAAGPIAQDG